MCVSEQESQRAKQQALSLRRENGTLDTECHERERQVNQLQTRVAVLEQEMKDKEQLVLRTKEVLEATQQQKVCSQSPGQMESIYPLNTVRKARIFVKMNINELCQL